MSYMPFLIAMLSGAAGTMALLGLVQVASAPNRRVRARLAATAPVTYDIPELNLLRDRRASGFGPLDALLRRREWTEHTRDRLDRAGIPLRVGEYALMRLGAGAAGAIFGLLVSLGIGVGGVWVVLMPAAFFAATALPEVYVSIRIRQRSEEIESQLVQLCDVMSAMVSSGFGYLQAMQTAAERIMPPLSDEIRRMLDEITLGADVDQALEDLNRRLNSADFDIVATAIAIQRTTGGNLGDILHGVAATIRGRQSLKREIRTLTSQQRLSAFVVAALPFVLALGLMYLLPEPFARLITQPAGRLMLVTAIIMDGAAFLVIRRVSKMDA
jgi:tight adherence protein B